MEKAQLDGVSPAETDSSVPPSTEVAIATKETNGTNNEDVAKGDDKEMVDRDHAGQESNDNVGGDNAQGERTWDTTSRKVIVYNVLKFIRTREVPKVVNSWLERLEDPNSVKVYKVKKPPTKNWIQVTLEKDEMVQPFIDLFSSNQISNRHGHPLSAKRADAPDTRQDDRDGRGSKRKNTNRQGSGSETKRFKKQQQEHETNAQIVPKTDDQVRDAITPTWREPYDKQLDKKIAGMVRKCALKIIQEVKNKFKTIEKESRKNKHRKKVEVYDWLNRSRAIEVSPILPSPKQVEYRNKCEFTFGYRHEVEQEEAFKEQDDSTAAENKDGQNDIDDKNDHKDNDVKIKKIPCVGFMASGWSGGISRPHCCQNVPGEACAIADILDEFLQTSPIPPYDARHHRGVWRTVAIRASRRTGECMIVIVHAPPAGGVGAKDDGTDDYSAKFTAERDRLVEMLTQDKDLESTDRQYPQVPSTAEKMVDDSNTTKDESDTGSDNSMTPLRRSCPIRVTSIFFQEYDGVSMPKPEHPVQHAFGKLALQEKLGKCVFQVSPGAFFQVNTECAEVLYNVVVEKVREVATKPQETLLFDVCCGTGTIGITCIKEGVVGRVVGVDISQPAIEDAKINADLNGFSKSDDKDKSPGVGAKTRFVASRAELAMAQELGNVKNDTDLSIVAVVDPAREGLHSDVIKAIRGNGRIERLVYVSCNPTATLVRDAAILCSPPTKRYPGRAFRPTSAQPVDMFPLTPHCEMVMTFDRIEESES